MLLHIRPHLSNDFLDYSRYSLMDRPSACPACGVPWDGHIPGEALVKPSEASQFEIEYYNALESGGWRCLNCSEIVADT